ncbi:superfamily II DNA/RNA helicase [Amorphus orientalis]|uniref:DEAD-box ATP-dependent RNA helicase RhpA n=1 Tax=Amorphus orientalis TaxID=649198 RepID=A0AAE3VSR9_9HYPH|nr:superfamily II DNA/RNA helicase [Amorphus orientalis]
MLSAIQSAGYTQPTPIQSGAIPHVLERQDVLGLAQTGTGKTASFVLPMLTLLEKGRARARMPRTLILEPTRELAAQVEENFTRYGVNHKLNIALLIGGVSFEDQNRKLERGADVLIATPGRLLDHSERGKLLLQGIEILVIDEADRMLDMGFIPDIERICKLLPPSRQTLFFSATMPKEIQHLVDKFLSNPARVEVSRPSSTAENVAQTLVAARDDPKDKRAALRRLIDEATDLKNAIVFCNRKRDVGIVFRSLERHGLSVGALHGDMDQRSRMTMLDNFRKGNLTIMVASDVAARGLDIPEVSHVFNFDVPHSPEDYVHRIGRTGRAGRTGVTKMIATPGDKKAVANIEKLIGKEIPWESGAPAAAAEETAEPAQKPKPSRRRSSSSAAKDETSSAKSPDTAKSSEQPKSSDKSGSKGRGKSGGGSASGDNKPPKTDPPQPKGRRGGKQSQEPVFGESEFVPAFLLRPVRPSPPTDNTEDDAASDDETGNSESRDEALVE